MFFLQFSVFIVYYLQSSFVVLLVFSNWRNFASSSLLSQLARSHLPSSILSGNFKCAARNNNYRPLVGPQDKRTHTHTHFHYRTRLLVRGTFHGIMFAHHKNTWDLSSSTAGLLCSAGSGSSSNSSPSSRQESSSFELNICVWGYTCVCVCCYPWQTMTLAICINPLWCVLPQKSTSWVAQLGWLLIHLHVTHFYWNGLDVVHFQPIHFTTIDTGSTQPHMSVWSDKWPKADVAVNRYFPHNHFRA